MKNILLGILSVLIFAMFNGGLQAQSIQGTVVNSTDGNPVAGAKVTLLLATDTSYVLSVTTEEDGRFAMRIPRMWDSNNVLIDHLLRITADGYDTLCFGVDLGMIMECQSVFPSQPWKYGLTPKKSESIQKSKE